MFHLSRRSALRVTGAALAAPALRHPASAAEIGWRVGHAAPVDTPLHRHLLDAAEAIQKRSDGQMTLTVIGEGRAGVPSGLLAQVRGGGLEMTVATNRLLAPMLALCSIPTIGFLFAEYARVWSALDGELGQMIRSQFMSKIGIEVFERTWDFGFRHITSAGRAIRVPGDLAGLKIRTQIDSDQMDMFRALDAVPVVITLPYLRAALEHHQIDAQEGMLPVVEYARLSEVQTYCAMTHHSWDGFWLCVNPNAWNKLPERLRHIVANTMNGAALRQREASMAMEASIRASLTRAGMTFTDVDHGAFQDLLRRHGYYDRGKTKFGEQVWDVVQRSTGLPR